MLCWPLSNYHKYQALTLACSMFITTPIWDKSELRLSLNGADLDFSCNTWCVTKIPMVSLHQPIFVMFSLSVLILLREKVLAGGCVWNRVSTIHTCSHEHTMLHTWASFFYQIFVNRGPGVPTAANWVALSPSFIFDSQLNHDHCAPSIKFWPDLPLFYILFVPRTQVYTSNFKVWLFITVGISLVCPFTHCPVYL